VTFASGLRGTYDVLKAQWLHTGSAATTRLQLYQTQFGSTAGGPFWDDLSFPDGVISLAATQGGRESGLSFDVDQLANERHHVLYGAEYRVNNSFLYQSVPTADETIASNPTLFSNLAYAATRGALRAGLTWRQRRASREPTSFRATGHRTPSRPSTRMPRSSTGSAGPIRCAQRSITRRSLQAA